MMRMIAHRVTCVVPRLNVLGQQGQRMLVRLKGGAKRIHVSSCSLHLNMRAEYERHGMVNREVRQTSTAVPVCGPVLHGEQPRVKGVATQQHLGGCVIYRDVRRLVSGGRENRQNFTAKVEFSAAIRPVGQVEEIFDSFGRRLNYGGVRLASELSIASHVISVAM